MYSNCFVICWFYIIYTLLLLYNFFTNCQLFKFIMLRSVMKIGKYTLYFPDEGLYGVCPTSSLTVGLATEKQEVCYDINTDAMMRKSNFT